jgi:uncharacterized membrane protein YgcG
MRKLIALLLVLNAAFAFTIQSYENNASVRSDGSLSVHERMVFDLEKQYNEGYRSIRPADAPSTDDVIVNSVKVDGQDADYYTDVYDGEVEIVWTRTHPGINTVELDYILLNKTELFDDFARVCYEHFGANWPSEAASFSSRMSMPEAARGKDMHFQVYSYTEGSASVDGLDVLISIDDVPSGNYIGGCYLFARDSVNTTNLRNGSALQILQDERESYGSEMVLEPYEPLPLDMICPPLALVLVAIAAYLFYKGFSAPKLPESILPPEDEEPVAVMALLRNKYEAKDIMAATMLDMINTGKMDIVELEKKGEDSAESKRERTILILKKTEGMRPHEKALADMIFSKGKEVDLDQMAKDFDSIKSESEAGKSPVKKGLERFKAECMKVLEDREMAGLTEAGGGKAFGMTVAVFGLFITVFFVGCFVLDYILEMADRGNIASAAAAVASYFASIGALAYIGFASSRPRAPESMKDKFMRWDAFRRGISSSRLKEYPPSSVLIWGRILVYATALGMADKVKKHLSELDTLTAERLEKLDRVRTSSFVFYGSALAVSNLATYGNRSGFSSSSSGGWSSGGGGGFSGGGSSGGGGFR